MNCLAGKAISRAGTGQRTRASPHPRGEWQMLLALEKMANQSGRLVVALQVPTYCLHVWWTILALLWEPAWPLLESSHLLLSFLWWFITMVIWFLHKTFGPRHRGIRPSQQVSHNPCVCRAFGHDLQWTRGYIWFRYKTPSIFLYKSSTDLLTPLPPRFRTRP